MCLIITWVLFTVLFLIISLHLSSGWKGDPSKKNKVKTHCFTHRSRYKEVNHIMISLDFLAQRPPCAMILWTTKLNSLLRKKINKNWMKSNIYKKGKRNTEQTEQSDLGRNYWSSDGVRGITLQKWGHFYDFHHTLQLYFTVSQ